MHSRCARARSSDPLKEKAIASVTEQGYCWAAWQPQVVALATSVVVVDRLCAPLLNLGKRLQDAISNL
jgi:hypothetical protein